MNVWISACTAAMSNRNALLSQRILSLNEGCTEQFSSSYWKRSNPISNDNDFLAPLITP